MRFGCAVACLAIGLASPALAQGAGDEPQRQLGAHVHGLGKLAIAIEKRTVEVELEAPGSDIVGFEHVARTPEQKAAVAAARATLSKPLALFKLPAAAGCKVASARVELVSGADHDHGHGHAGHAHAETASKTGGTARGSEPGKASAQAEPPRHTEFHAEYKLTCAKPELLRTLELGYFTAFPKAEALDVTLLGPKGQSRQNVTRDKPRLDLSGTS